MRARVMVSAHSTVWSVSVPTCYHIKRDFKTHHVHAQPRVGGLALVGCGFCWIFPPRQPQRSTHKLYYGPTFQNRDERVGFHACGCACRATARSSDERGG